MRSDPEDRLYPVESKQGPSIGLILAVIAAAAIIGVMYFTRDDNATPATDKPVSTQTLPEPPAQAARIPAAPDIPTLVAPVVESSPEEPPAPVEPTATLEDSDRELRAILAADNNTDLISSALASANLVQRSTGIIDGLSRGLVPRKILPLPPPKEKFSTATVNGQLVTDAASYARYDKYAQAIASLDIDLLVSTFHRYRALLEQAYEELGFSPGDLDNALIRSLDYVLATPVITEPPALNRKEAVFQYVDPRLEQLTPAQKQLLRMGPENAAKIKQQARLLRNGLLHVPG